MHVLAESDVGASIGMAESIPVIRKALEEYAASRADSPLRTEIRMPDRGVLSLFMPAHVPAFSALGHKLIAEFPANAERDLPVLTGSLSLLDYETGLVSAVMGATYLTNLRTGALTGVAASHLAPPGAQVGAVLGTGGLSAAQAWGLSEALELTEIRIWGRQPHKARQVADKVSDLALRGKPRVRAMEEAEAAVTGADVIVTATSARSPILEDDWLAGGELVCAMGSNSPHMQELPVSLMARADRVVADSRTGVVDRAGDVVKAVEAGALDPSLVEELSDVVAGQRSSRRTADELIVFKSCGFAALDIALAAETYRLAQQRGLGQVVELGQEGN